ncbi:MAG: protein kinase [Myxococcales bacterium]|nr:protein kinase [Myxococcales bacterium]
MSREFADGQIVPGTRYRVLGHLGSGGMGSVYLVEHTELGKPFVLKALFRELASRKDLVARLRQEWRALARLNHANIVNVTDAGTSDNGVPFYVMERVEGETLADLLKREHALGIPRALGLAAAVLDGLSAAHEISIVHRDVKPPNIFVVTGGGVKILDFGIAKLADQSAEVITARGVAIGTPRYMSPEQAKGQAVDARADLYAVGLVLFEAIAGEGPFDDARDANELLLAHLSKPVPKLSSFHRGVSPELDQIVSGLLAKDPAARPSSAKQVAASLRALLKRAARVPSTSSVTPEAGYQDPTQGEVTALPSTRPDGVAGRVSELPTVEAPLVARRSNPPPSVNTTLIGGTPVDGTTTLSATADTKTGMEWAKDGFQTVAGASSVALGVEDTLVASAPPSAAQSGPVRDDYTLPIDGPVTPPPNEAPTRTSVPAAELSPPMPGTRSMPQVSPLPAFGLAETPPPFMSATPAPSSRTPAPSRTPLYLGVLALVILVGGVGSFAALRGRASAPKQEPAALVEALPNPPEPEPTLSAEPAPSPEPAPLPSAEAPAAAPALAQTARTAVVRPAPKPERAPEKPRDKRAEPKPAATKLPASGL